MTISGFPQPVVDAVDKSVKTYPEKWTGGVCAYVLHDRETGANLGGRPCNGACHASISYMNQESREKDSILVNAHKYEWHQKSPDFLRWVARDCPFSRGFLNGDNEKEIFEHAGVIDMKEVGHVGALWMVKAIRHFQEEPWKIDYWNLLYEKGLDGLQAFIGCDILDGKGSPNLYSTHCGLFSYKSPTEIRKMYDTTRAWTKLEDCPATQGSYGMTQNWGSLSMKTVQKSDGWGGFIEYSVPCDATEYVEKLKEIFEGDPKNVK
jgi:hypothetical protein